MTLEEQILHYIRAMDSSQQEKILAYAKSLQLVTPSGTSGEVLLKFVGAIPIDDLDRMEKAINEDLERIDADAW